MSMAAASMPHALPASLAELLKLLKKRDAHVKGITTPYDHQLQSYVLALEQELEIIGKDTVIAKRVAEMRKENLFPASVVPPSSVCFYCGRKY